MHRTSSWFASYANCTGLNLVLPHMLIAQDFMFASYANCTGLNLVSPRMLIAQDFMFASYANCTGLDLVSPRMLIAQDFMFASYANCTGLDFIFHHFFLLGLTSECRFGWDLKFFEDFWFNGTYLLSPRRSFWSFYQVWDSSSFCIHISDRETCIWCSMSCDVWLCMNEMLILCFFLSITFATFLPVHTLQACWCSFFLLCLRRYFYLDTCLSRRILLFVLGDILFQTFQYKTHGFSSLRSGFYHSCVITKFRMNNEKLLMQMQLI